MQRSRSKRSRGNSPSHFEQLESRQLMSGGQLDLNLGQLGIAKPNLGFTPEDVAVMRDGRIVIVGGIGRHWMIARLNPNGTPDPTFGDGDGIQSVDMGDSSQVHKVAIQRDGRIVAGGIVKDNSITSGAFFYEKVGLVRFNLDGSLDKSFDGDGKAQVVNRRQFETLGDLKIAPDGKIVFTAGDEDAKFLPYPHVESDVVVGRVNTNGSLDTTFGDLQPGTTRRKGWTSAEFGGYDVSSAIAFAPGGKIVVGGTRQGADRDHGGFYDYIVARYNSNGTLDKSFDGDGKLSFNMIGNNHNSLNSVAVQTDGKIVVGGTANNGFALARINVDGKLDNAFGFLGNGRVYTRLSSRLDVLKSISIDTRGRITAIGTADKNFNLNVVGKYVAAVQYVPSGARDGAFGDAGIQYVDTGSIIVRGVGIQPGTNKIVIAGMQNNGVTLMRMHQQIAKIDVYDDKRRANENYDRSASIKVVRDDVYDFPTRVYLLVQGDATMGADYTLPNVQTMTIGGKVLRYVDIPAGQREVVVPINVLDDFAMEYREVVAFNPINDASYLRGPTNTAAAIIDDAEMLNINFQKLDAGFPKPTADLGFVYGDRAPGLKFGWDQDNTANARNRGNPASPDGRYDSLNHMQKNGANRKWEMAVPNGKYDVRVVVGDASNTDSVYRVNVENQLAVAGTPSGDVRWFRGTIRVNVTDGRLTITNGTGAINNRICFIDVKMADPAGAPGTVFSSTPVRQYSAATASNWHKTQSGHMADNQIDEIQWE